jgi:dTDP-4-amino-4,6-dideoxygalactose transaminase
MFDFEPGSEIITTPFTFAATAHAIAWNNLVPVFADIDDETLTIDPNAVQRAITARTRAILAVHVYGTTCDLSALAKIAVEHDLRLVYDAAHAFGVEVGGRGIGTFGDASIFSFHATKLFTTLEGGAIATPRIEDAEQIYMLRNFGIRNEEEIVAIGINGKLNELQAAIGLLNLDIYRAELEKRRNIRANYDQRLGGIAGITFQPKQDGITASEQYYVIRIDPTRSGFTRDIVYDALKEHNIFARKYFYPACTDFVPYRHMQVVTDGRNIPVVEIAKKEVLCLPFHSRVDAEHIDCITRVLINLSRLSR